jgi:hypothetical protein
MSGARRSLPAVERDDRVANVITPAPRDSWEAIVLESDEARPFTLLSGWRSAVASGATVTPAGCSRRSMDVNLSYRSSLARAIGWGEALRGRCPQTGASVV